MRRRSAPTGDPPPPDDLRCRRSNGKDWRCAEQALPELSYCAYHHHLNYHRPPSDRQSLDPVASGANRPAKPKRRRDVLNSQNLHFAELQQAPPLRRRKKRRRAEQPESGFANLSNSLALIPQMTGEDPIYDALPVRFRASNSLSSLLSTGEEEELDIYNSVPISVQIPVSVPVSDELRCRRSNGKEWRCSEQALPGLSYCPYHHNLNYNRSGTKQKPKNMSRGTSRALVILERESDERENEERESGNNNNNSGLCKRTNGKGWRCPNLAVEGLSYCPYHHQLNYRGTSNNNNENNNDINLGNVGTSGTKMRGDVGIIGLDGLLVKRPRNRKTWFI